MSLITMVTWVPRGVAAPFPQKYKFDEAEFDRIASMAKLNLDDANNDLVEAKARESGGIADAEGLKKASEETKDDSEIDDDLKEYDLQHYDDDPDEDIEVAQSMGMFGNVKSLAYYENNDSDPYITMPEDVADKEEREELQILATDNLVLAAKVEDDLAHLEVYVYEDDSDNLYVHHDIMLPAVPICVEWLDIGCKMSGFEKDAKANFAAIGTMDPDIELWDLDTVDCMYPNAILGQGANPADEKKRKKKKKAKKANDEYHVAAVLSLAANKKHRHLLASASADKTVKLWDLHTATCAKSYKHHTDKVCSVAWHPVESTVLLSGSYDRTVVAADMRAPNSRPSRWGVESDVEMVRWDPHDPNYFFVATEGGVVHYYDARDPPPDPERSNAVWTLQAHDQPISSIDPNMAIPGFIATGSTDKMVKLWKISPSGPSMVLSRDLDVGKVFSAKFGPDPEVAFRLAVAGSKSTVHIWDTSTNLTVRRAFAERVPAAVPDEEIRERLVGLASDESESDDDEEEEEGSSDGDVCESMDGNDE